MYELDSWFSTLSTFSVFCLNTDHLLQTQTMMADWQLGWVFEVFVLLKLRKYWGISVSIYVLTSLEVENVNGVIFMSNWKQLRNVGKRKLLFRDQNGGSTKLCLSYGDSENCEGLPRNRWLYKELQIESWDKQEVESWNAGQSLKVLMTKVLWHDIKLWVCAKMPRPLTWKV